MSIFLLLAVFVGLIGWSIASFRAELARIRFVLDSDDIDLGVSRKTGAQDLREAADLLVGVEGSLDQAYSSLKWELFGFTWLADPVKRENDMLQACSDANFARHALGQAKEKLALDLDLGPEVPVLVDPITRLAAEKRWVLWGFVQLMPRIVRRLVAFGRARRELLTFRTEVLRLQGLTDELTVAHPVAAPKMSRLAERAPLPCAA